nr:putative integron gene cassette protein [uncultured bacterium]
MVRLRRFELHFLREKRRFSQEFSTGLAANDSFTGGSNDQSSSERYGVPSSSCTCALRSRATCSILRYSAVSGHLDETLPWNQSSHGSSYFDWPSH